MKTLKEFYNLISATINPRRAIVASILKNSSPSDHDIDLLKKTLITLSSSTDKKYNTSLQLDETRSIELNLDYEITELEKDLLFIEKGEDALLNHMRLHHPHFDKQIQQTADQLKDIHFHSMITDRDGTINNYCGRYLSSIQSIYNAVFITRFAHTINQPCILTSAPLADRGLIDISTTAPHDFILAGSKGREALTRRGKKIYYEGDPQQTAKHVELNHLIKNLVKQPPYEKFTYIGSGLQIKFGQTALARQDISESIDEQESLALLEHIKKLVHTLDPKKEYFRIEDTGKDIEIHLTIGDGDALKDFDKGDGITFLNQAAQLQIEKGPALICGDTFSDAPMISATQPLTETHTIFVTTDPKLINHVHELDPQALILDSPDTLVAAMNTLAQ